jgi:hypothetical protein
MKVAISKWSDLETKPLGRFLLRSASNEKLLLRMSVAVIFAIETMFFCYASD